MKRTSGSFIRVFTALLVTALTIDSCKMDSLTDKTSVQQGSKSLFFDVQNYKQTSIDTSSGFHNTTTNQLFVKQVISDLKNLDVTYHFSEKYVTDYGYPLWQFAIAYSNEKEQGVFIPVVKPNSNFIGKMLFAVSSAQSKWLYQDFNIKDFDKKVIGPDQSTEFKVEDFLKFTFLLFNQSLSGVEVPCSAVHDIHSLTEESLRISHNPKGAKMEGCDFISGFDGYCEWAGTPSNPYSDFHGCFGSYTSVYVCDNPDAYWAQHSGSSFGLSTGDGSAGGNPTPNEIDQSLTNAETHDNTRLSLADCKSFTYKRTTQNGQEAALRFNLRFAESDPGLDQEYDNFTIQFRYLRFSIPYNMANGRVISSGEAANASAKAFNDAWDTCVAQYNSDKDGTPVGVLMDDIKRTFLREIRSNLTTYLNTTSIVIGSSTTGSPPPTPRDLEFVLPWQDPYSCN